jgi:hypothetical protein
MSDWHYDRDPLLQLEGCLQRLGHSTYLIWPENLEEALVRLREGTLSFRYILDRASNTSPEFSDLYGPLSSQAVITFEDPDTLLRASDKAVMHRLFESEGISVPNTLILEPHSQRREVLVEPQDLEDLGVPFVIKPANTTGGGTGVHQDGRALEDILVRRREYPFDSYLVQERILPKVARARRYWFRRALEDILVRRREYPFDSYLVQERILPKVAQARRYWFRVFYAAGDVYPCWWDDLSHVYETLDAAQAGGDLFALLDETIRAIARLSSLLLFSAELVLDQRERLVVVDYVNESPDLRRKSRYHDGVPDEVVEAIIGNLTGWIHRDLGAPGLSPP